MTSPPARNRSNADHWLLPLLYLIAVGVRTATALQLAAPSSFDAQYYYLVAKNLVAGRGLVVDALWQFLDRPVGFPHPAGGVWLPLPSLLQALFLLLSRSYRAAQIPQILLSSALVLLAYLFTRRLTGRVSDGLVAAGLVLFGGGTVMATQLDVDCYATFALTAGLAIYAMSRDWSNPYWLAASGLFMGLAALTRNDAILLLAVFGLFVLWLRHRGQGVSFRVVLLTLGLFVGVCAPWWLRNWLTFGRVNPVPPLYPALLREYGEFFAFEPQFTLQHLLSAGWSSLLQARLNALGMNGLRLIWTFQFWQAPFIALGALAMTRPRASSPRDRPVAEGGAPPSLFPVLLYPLLLFLAMSLVYVFPGLQGGFSHSLSAWVPFGAALAAVGLRCSWQRLARVAGVLDPRRSLRVFQVGAVLVACLIGVTVARTEIVSNRRLAQSNARVAEWVKANTDPQTIILTNNGLGISLFAERRTLAIPFGGLATAQTAARRFGAELLIVWGDRPQGLPAEFTADLASIRLPLVASWDGCQVYLLGGN
ncbi:MAG: hypothetical protein BWY10_00433 [Chloroflexi bacterium ADurb.Bin180]|nr:MAG: hypothetical protein BWY10_00433 [Chloroflexi bacterium ADurb.Bin180]